jgi:hypothetical protein
MTDQFVDGFKIRLRGTRRGAVMLLVHCGLWITFFHVGACFAFFYFGTGPAKIVGGALIASAWLVLPVRAVRISAELSPSRFAARNLLYSRQRPQSGFVDFTVRSLPAGRGPYVLCGVIRRVGGLPVSWMTFEATAAMDENSVIALAESLSTERRNP